MMQAVTVGVIAPLMRFARTGGRNFLYMLCGMAGVMLSRVLALRRVAMIADRLHSRKRR